MLSKPVKWRRAGMAALAGVSVALTALAAQVSPPNVQAVDEATQGAAPAKAAGRVAIKLPSSQLDRYVGTYKVGDMSAFVDIKRSGDSLEARVNGQPWFEIFPESEQKFFWKVADAQISFVLDGSGLVQSAVLHQHGENVPMTRVDVSESAAAQAALDARIQAQTPQPGSEAALRRCIESALNGRINYDDMEPVLANVLRNQEAAHLASARQLGALQSLTFKGVGSQGWDAYEAQFANGKLTYHLSLSANGKIAGMMALALP